MRGWILLAWLMAAPATAGDDLAQMNAVSKAWDRYAELSSQDKAESVELLAASSLAHFGFLRDAALYASPEQVRRIPTSDRILVYLLRASRDERALKALDDRAVAVLCMTEGWAGVEAATEDQPLMELTHVTVMEDRAVGEVGAPTETHFQFGPALVREQGQWRYEFVSMVPDVSKLMEATIQQSGASSAQVLEFAVANLLKAADARPSLALLDRALVDDPGARTRLNEAWPDYEGVYRHRVAAVTRKAEADDPFAQYALGALLVSGNAPTLVARDESRGIDMLERASDNGNANAADAMVRYLYSDPAQLDEARLQRMLRHVRRAAEAGKPEAMVTLGLFYLEGAGGLVQDCRQAADWQARGEEAGVSHARNEQVWTWATCPIATQRDPARALSLAKHMMSREDALTAGELDTVAAALAANGKFDDAIRYQSLAIEKLSVEPATRKARSGTLKRMQTRLKGYRQGRDYVQDYNTFAEMKAGRY